MAILLASLVPALGHAVSSATGADWIEICTTQGSKWIQAGEPSTEQPAGSVHLLEHCPYCSLHTPTPGLAPVTDLVYLPLRLTHAVPLAFLSAARTPHAWVSAQPRAPPLFS